MYPMLAVRKTAVNEREKEIPSEKIEREAGACTFPNKTVAPSFSASGQLSCSSCRDDALPAGGASVEGSLSTTSQLLGGALERREGPSETTSATIRATREGKKAHFLTYEAELDFCLCACDYGSEPRLRYSSRRSEREKKKPNFKSHLIVRALSHPPSTVSVQSTSNLEP